MKRYKNRIIKAVAMLMLLAAMFSLLASTAYAATDEIMPYFNNTSNASAIFDIDDGEAIVNITYNAYKDAFTEARIYVKLEKRRLLVFWKDVTEWEIVSDKHYNNIEFKHAVDSGTYRATIRVEIDGTYGATDVIEKELKAEY